VPRPVAVHHTNFGRKRRSSIIVERNLVISSQPCERRALLLLSRLLGWKGMFALEVKDGWWPRRYGAGVVAQPAYLLDTAGRGRAGREDACRPRV